MKGEGSQFLAMLEKAADPADLPVLLAACAGRRVHVPHTRATDHSWIVLTIGRERADELVCRLSENGWYGGEVDVPFNGGGLLRAFHKAIRNRVAECVREGKSNQIIAAEIGITKRAVLLNKAKLRRLGELPEVDQSAALTNHYLGATRATAKWAGAPELPQPAGADAAQADDLAAVAVPIPDDATARERILAILQRECGPADAAQLVSATGLRAVSLHPRALRRPTHPFHAVLGEERAVRLAMQIVGAGLGDGPVRLAERPERLTPLVRSIRAKLLERILPVRIAADLNVPIQKVHSQTKALRKAGLLPPACAGRRTLRGY